MRRMRSLNFQRSSTTKATIDNTATMDSPNHFTPGHSRDSSGASSASSPPTSSTSTFGHNRWPSSSSSLATSPESPSSPTRPALHDLVEDPEERDEFLYQEYEDLSDQPFCICMFTTFTSAGFQLIILGDTTNCDHRRTMKPLDQAVMPASPEWTHGDDQYSEYSFVDAPSFKKRKSGEGAAVAFAKRASRRWPSISQRWTDRKATISLSSPAVHSAPPTRSVSLQSTSPRLSLASHLDPRDPLTPPTTPARSRANSTLKSRQLPEPMNIKMPEPAEDPIDRDAENATPLLLVLMKNPHDSAAEMPPPLQAPSVAPTSNHTSALNTPLSPPGSPQFPTPDLSTKPSIASISMGRPSHGLHSSQDIPSLLTSQREDPWADKLRHANFSIYPEPYMPQSCDLESCNALLENWELARSRYMRHATRIAEHYGPTSQVFHYTEQKWAEIDSNWRTNFDVANESVDGQNRVQQSLAEHEPISRMPTLNDPRQPAKFPTIDDTEIVGPMVRYVKLQAKPSKKPTFLKIFTSPASLLAGRSPFGSRRPSV